MEPPKTDTPAPAACYIKMSAKQILDTYKDTPGGRPSWSVLGDGQAPPTPPLAPEVHLSDEQLAPLAPFVFIESNRDAFSLQEFCLEHPITVVRGLNATLNLDLGLFSTKTLVEAWPQHVVEQRTQLMQSVDENWDESGSRRVWECTSQRSTTTVKAYARYQAKCFQDSLTEDNERSPLFADSIASSDLDGSSNSGPIKGIHRQRTLRFATNVDLSDESKWRSQFEELKKLPAFLCVKSTANMLSHVGHDILGMNTVQLYMKVPGSRTPAHQENNNFCSVNINIGPGDCVWFGVPNAYWGVVNKLCERHGLSFLHGSWWPDTDELRAYGVPVYRFTQRPGDLVFVNTGCVHWVQATGCCNNIAWNVGPITTIQYSLALERYEWNKIQNFVSIVPMVRLTWNLAKNIKVSDPQLHSAIKTCLMQTLRAVACTLAIVKAKNVPISIRERTLGEMTQYCVVCKREVWHVLLARELHHVYIVYCLECAERFEPSLQSFSCLEEHRMNELAEVYDTFILHRPPPPAPFIMR